MRNTLPCQPKHTVDAAEWRRVFRAFARVNRDARSELNLCSDHPDARLVEVLSATDSPARLGLARRYLFVGGVIVCDQG